MTPTSRPDLEELYLSKLKRAVQKRCFIVFVDYPIAEMVTSPSARRYGCLGKFLRYNAVQCTWRNCVEGKSSRKRDRSSLLSSKYRD